MQNINKHGLSRDIPLPIKRVIRQRCGYGCVLCGGLFCQYHHFDPQFTEAKGHKSEGITMLCKRHHDEVTNGRISENKVRLANANPYSVKNKHAKYVFEDLSFPLEVGLGGLVFITPDGALLKIDSEKVMSVQYDDEGIATFSGVFCSPNGEKLVVENNELTTSTGHWDIDSKSREIIIRDSSKEVVFHLTFTPPHRLQVIKIKNYYKGTVIDSEFSKKLFLKSSSGINFNFASGFIVIGGDVELNKDKGIIIRGGSLVMGSEMENAFKGTTMDYLIGEVNKIRQMNALEKLHDKPAT